MTGSAPAKPRLPVVLLVLITALGPTSLQIFVPALPVIQAAFGTSAARVQLVLSLSVLAMAVSTLFYGPLADRYGRRPVLVLGLVLFVAGSLLCTLAPTLELLVVGRVVQAIGGASGFVLIRTMVADLYRRDETARVLATVTMAMVVGPMVAPAVGAFLTDLWGWRAIFLAMTVAGGVLLPFAARRLPETLRPGTERSEIGALLMGFVHLLRSPRFCGYAFCLAFSVSIFFSFISAAPYLMVNVLGRSVTEYGFYFMFISASFVVGNYCTRRWAAQWSLDRLAVLGSVVALVAALSLAALALLRVWTPLALFLPAAVAGFANGLSIPAAQAGAVSVDPERGGTASGLAGFIQMFLASLVTQGVGMVQNDTPYPMAGFMVGSALLALVAILVGTRYRR